MDYSVYGKNITLIAIGIKNLWNKFRWLFLPRYKDMTLFMCLTL